MEALSVLERQVLRYPRRPGSDLERRLRGLVRQCLRVPIFYKVLVANTSIVVGAAILETWLAPRAGEFGAFASGSLVAVFMIGGVATSLFVNFIVLKAAFQPLVSLERTVEAVRRGDLLARASHVAFGDPQVDQLIDTLNSMLDDLVVYREQVQLLSRQVLTAQEGERQRIARELHDETAQSLTSLLIGLRMVEKSTTPQDLQSRIAELRSQTMRTLEEVRKMAVDLRPSTLDDLGLAAALQWYTGDFARRTRIDVSFRATELDARLTDDVEVVIYRIIQEALTNVAKHSEASRVEVCVALEDRSVVATVVDNGVGFDVPSIMRSHERGLGLFGMQERVALVGGTFRIVSVPGEGTRVVVQVPTRYAASSRRELEVLA